MKRKDEERVMLTNPLDEDDVIARIYKPGAQQELRNGQVDGHNLSHELPTAPMPNTPARKEKPSHYKVVSISLYLEDIARLDSLVRELKRRGFTKMNRSALIRYAIDTVDIDHLPRQY